MLVFRIFLIEIKIISFVSTCCFLNELTPSSLVNLELVLFKIFVIFILLVVVSLVAFLLYF